MSVQSPFVLVVLDGYGERQAKPSNAIANAHKPHLEALWTQGPTTLLEASGLAVGLPAGQMGNSEVGHLNLGAGRVVYQDFSVINNAVLDGTFHENPILKAALCRAVEHDGSLHILGLLSPGGIHSHQNHLVALLSAAAKRGLKKVFLHAFLDGRDTPPRSAEASIRLIQDAFVQTRLTGGITSLIGRYYAMDRDKRWERTESAYRLIVDRKAGFLFTDPLEALHAAYERGENDEFVQASLIQSKQQPASGLSDRDTWIFMNFRADRAQQLSFALTQPDFTEFRIDTSLLGEQFFSLTEYGPDLNRKSRAIFSKPNLHRGLAEWLSIQKKTQLRLSETEKFAHVTFFFNGGRHEPFEDETRSLVPSPKVSTYDLQPEMSSAQLTQALIHAILSKKYDFILCNYPNADMVGHTGNYSAAIKAIEALDACMGALIQAVESAQGQLLITADHGNAELMFDPFTGQPHTAHTTSLVPCFYVGPKRIVLAPQGKLADIAPTVLTLMNLPIPPEMTGKNLAYPAGRA